MFDYFAAGGGSPVPSDTAAALSSFGLRVPAVDTAYSPLPMDAHTCTFTFRAPAECRERLYTALNALTAEDAWPPADIAGLVGITVSGAGDAAPTLTDEQQAALTRIRDQIQLTLTAHQASLLFYVVM